MAHTGRVFERTDGGNVLRYPVCSAPCYRLRRISRDHHFPIVQNCPRCNGESGLCVVELLEYVVESVTRAPESRRDVRRP